MRLKSRVVLLLWIGGSFALLLLVIKFFVADVYRITSGSMRPSLFGGAAEAGGEVFSEWVLVKYDRSPELERFDVVVIDREGRDPVIKRVVALPGESVRIQGGDLIIDGERLPADTPRPKPIPVFDDSLHAVEEHFRMAFGPEEPWQERDGYWSLDAADIVMERDGGRSSGMMFFGPDIRDDYIDQTGQRVPGLVSANDAVLECEVRLELLRGQLILQLTESGDTFEVRVRPNGGLGSGDVQGSHIIELVRRNAGMLAEMDPALRERVEARSGVDLPLHQWLQVSFSNIDNHVRVDLPGLGVALSFDYEANELFPGKTPFGDQNVGSRVALGGEGVRAGFRSIRVSRDLFYTSVPERNGFGVGSPEKTEHGLVFLGPEDVFLLGDNSIHSNDSRHTGPFSTDEIIGRPLLVVWPWRRCRIPRGARRDTPGTKPVPPGSSR